MKINSVISYNPFCTNSAKNNNKVFLTQNIAASSSENTTEYSLLPYVSNNIAFTGRRKDLEDRREMLFLQKQFTPEAEKIFEEGKKIARAAGSSKIETRHIYLASLLELNKYIEELDAGSIKYDEESRQQLPAAVEGLIYPGCTALSNPKSRAKIKKVTKEHIYKVKKDFAQSKADNAVKSAITTKFAFPPSPSKELIDDLDEAYNLIASQVQSDTFYDNYFYIAANYSQDRKLVREALSFNTDLQKALMIDDCNLKKKKHLQFYDDKADNIWKNISHGNDVIYLYDANDESASSHLVSSFVNLINKPGQSYKNLDPDKTDIILLNKYATFELVEKLANEAKTNKEKKGRTTVITGDLLSLIKNDNGAIGMDTVKMLANEDSKQQNSNLRFVFGFNPESYYANTAKGSAMAPVLSDYAVQTIPSLNASDALKYLTDDKGLGFIENEIKHKFSKETVVKAIELTSTQEGSYPDKVINVLSGASKYFIDEEDITPEKLEKYVSETRKLTETSLAEQSNIIFDTGKTTADIIGSPMTKKDAKTIVNQIKQGTIGTRGFIAQLEDGSSYGGGRRHTAEAIAGEAKIPMITINARDFALKDIDALSQNANLSEMKIKTIVSAAKAQAEANENKTAMIFIENFDNFASNPLYGISSIYEQKAFSQLLAEMENARKNDDVNLIVVGSANMPEVIDTNIMKPYKFLNSIIVYPPKDSNQRKEVLDYYIEKMNLQIAGDTKEERDETVKNAAETTYGFTVADLMYLLDVVKTVAGERNKEKIDGTDFTEAYLRATTGRTNETEISPARKRITASHEAGHAINLQVMYEIAEKSKKPWHLPDKVNFITLDPRGSFGGAMYHKSSGNEEYSYEKVMSDIICSFGGHSAEKIIYNMAGSYGISSDMEHVTGLAKAAVLDMGMGPRTGVAHIERNALGSPDVSEKKLARIEEDIDSFVNAACKISDMIVEEYKDFICEFTDKYSKKVGTGESLVSSETFIKELNRWRENLPEEKRESLIRLEKDIEKILEETKTGKD